MKSVFFSVLIVFITAGTMTSCSTDDDLTGTSTYPTEVPCDQKKTPANSSGGELDDPVESDRDDD